MSNCCKFKKLKQLGSSATACPKCGIKGKEVPTLTVKHLVRDHTRVMTDESYLFCRTPSCNVVYFAPSCVFGEEDIKVSVGLKAQAHPATVCYCFGYTREDIQQDIEQRSPSPIPRRIKAEIQAGFCACEVKNPSGDCCLGDIMREIQHLKKHSLPIRHR